SCNKEDTTDGGYPKLYRLYFEMMDKNGRPYENGKVEITSNTGIVENIEELTSGQYPFLAMGKIITEMTQGNEKDLFGHICGAPNCESDYSPLEFASGAENPEAHGSTPIEKDKYWLLRYPNEDVDTLRIHDVYVVEPYSRAFTFFVNGLQIEANNMHPQNYIITIQK